MKSYKDIVEALKGNQHKIDKNKNGKIDAHDFKLLRKEETEIEEGLKPEHNMRPGWMLKADPELAAKLKKNKDIAQARKTAYGNPDAGKTVKEEKEEDEDRMARSDYKVSPSGRKSHKEIVFKHGESDKKDLEERTMTDAEMKKREEIVKSMKKSMDGFKDRYGDRAKDVMYATATKMAMREAVQKADIPAYLRKQQGQAPLKMSDLKRKDTISDKENLAKLRGVKEEIDEAFINGREYASHGLMHPDHAARDYHKVTGQHIDFYAHGTGDKVEGKVIKNDGKEVHIKDTKGTTHKFKVQRGLPKQQNEEVELDEAMSPQQKNDFDRMMAGAMSRASYNAKWKKPLKSDAKVIYGKNVKEDIELEEAKKEDVPFDGPYTKTNGETKDKSGAVHTPMSRAKHLARMAMKKQMKEDIDRLFEKDDSEYNYEGEMAITQLKTICRHAEALEAKLKPDTNLPEWVQSKITLAMDYMQTAHDYLMSELDEQAPVAPVPGQKWKDHAVMVNGKQRVVIKRSNVKNYPEHEGWKEVSPGQKLKEDDEVQFSYSELMMMVEARAQYLVKATHKDSGRVKVTTYVADKDETEGSVRSRAEREHKPSGYQIDSVRRKDVEAHGEGDEEETSSTTQKRGRGRPAGSKSGARGPRIK